MHKDTKKENLRDLRDPALNLSPIILPESPIFKSKVTAGKSLFFAEDLPGFSSFVSISYTSGLKRMLKNKSS